MEATPKTIFIVACEQSGDNYGALLARELKRQHAGVKLAGLGGPKMRAEGVELLENMIEHSAMGIAEVLGSVSFFLRTMRRVVEEAARRKADVAVLIDSPDFNLRIAPKLRAAGVKVSYYVSPQLWVWRSGRIKQIQRDVNDMMTILPFEKEWYAKRGVDVAFVGHPMLDLIDLKAMRTRGVELPEKLLAGGKGPLVGILPGSRRNEISRLLPRFLDAARLIKRETPDARFALGCSTWLNDARAREFLAPYGELSVEALHGQTNELMAASDYLLCCSGTATLEAALIGTPLLMAYRFSWPTWCVGKVLISSNQYFCLPNIILNKEVAPEMIQTGANPKAMARTALDGLKPERQKQTRAELAALESLLGGAGASERAAARVLKLAVL